MLQVGMKVRCVRVIDEEDEKLIGTCGVVERLDDDGPYPVRVTLTYIPEGVDLRERALFAREELVPIGSPFEVKR